MTLNETTGKNGSVIKVGDEVKGIQFEDLHYGLFFTEEMGECIGVVGIVTSIYTLGDGRDDRVKVQFPGQTYAWAYPAHLIELSTPESLADILKRAKFGDRITAPDEKYVGAVKGKNLIVIQPTDKDGDALVAYQDSDGEGVIYCLNLNYISSEEKKFHSKRAKPVVDFTPYLKLAELSIAEYPRGKGFVYAQLSHKLVNAYEKQYEFSHYVKDAIIEGNELPVGTLQFLKRMAATFITLNTKQQVQKTLRLELAKQQSALTKLIAYQHRKGAKGETS